MLCHPAFCVPASFMAAVDTVNTATDAATARVHALPSVLGDIAFDVDRALRAAIDDINTRWVHALTMHNVFPPHVADNPSALHQAALAVTHDTVEMCAPIELAAIVVRVAKLRQQIKTWRVSMEHIGIHAHFSVSLKLLEANYAVVRAAAVRADLIMKVLYCGDACVSVDKLSSHDLEDSLESVNGIFHLLDHNLQAIFMSDIKPVLIDGHIEVRQSVPVLKAGSVCSTYVGFKSLGAIGSAPSFGLASHLTRSVRAPVPMCSNCRERPVAANTRCFTDWCHRCDYSLWITCPLPDTPCVNPIQCADYFDQSPVVCFANVCVRCRRLAHFRAQQKRRSR